MGPKNAAKALQYGSDVVVLVKLQSPVMLSKLQSSLSPTCPSNGDAQEPDQ